MHFPVAPAGREGVGEAVIEVGTVVGALEVGVGGSEEMGVGMLDIVCELTTELGTVKGVLGFDGGVGEATGSAVLEGGVVIFDWFKTYF